MSEKLLAIYDNQKRIGTCDECGSPLRYEYVTDKGIYGSECIHKHIHDSGWITFKGKKDIERFNLRQKVLNSTYDFFTASKSYLIYYFEFRDGSGYFQYFSKPIDKEIGPEILLKLLSDGYSKTFYRDAGHYKIYFIERPNQ